MRVREYEVIFNVFQSSKYPLENDVCFKVDIINECVAEIYENPKDPLRKDVQFLDAPSATLLELDPPKSSTRVIQSCSSRKNHF